MAEFDLIVTGHITYDIIEDPERGRFKAIGGVATYTSLVAAKLGAKVGVISKVGSDFERAHLKHFIEAGVDLEGLRFTLNDTTTFENIYDVKRNRKQRILRVGEKIELSDVPERYLRSKCFHFGPVFHEVSYDIIRYVHGKGILTSLDVQGFCRRMKDHSVTLHRWKDAGEVLPEIDILKCDGEEAKVLTGEKRLEAAAEELNLLGSRIVLVTLGDKGSILNYDGKTKKIPAIPVDRIVDLTGAGDTFIAAFILEYLESGDPEYAALFASCTAAFKIMGVGTSTIPNKQSILKKLKELNILKG